MIFVVTGSRDAQMPTPESVVQSDPEILRGTACGSIACYAARRFGSRPWLAATAHPEFLNLFCSILHLHRQDLPPE